MPDDISKWFKLRAYGSTDADEDARPLGCRSTSLLFWKKAISFFMPNTNMQWNELSHVGNPPRSQEVNKLIKTVRRKETARLGKPSEARKALYASEFEQAIELMENSDDAEMACFLSAFFRFQYHLIARIDDSAKFRHPDIKVYHQYPQYGIIVKLCWSKNVMEERDAPDQLLMGANDWRYCPLVGLGLWLEYHFMINPEQNDFYFGIQGLNDLKAIKKRAADCLRGIFRSGDFNVVDDGKTGTHSMRKFATTVARGSGCSKDDTDCRARWKSHRRQQDQYANVTIPYDDAKVAAALCRGGPVAYIHTEGSGITDDWILQYVVPATRQKLSREVCIVLGRALLWRIFDESGSFIPDEIKSRVCNAYNNLGDQCTLENGVNPIKKIPLGIGGNDAEVVIDELFTDEGDEAVEDQARRVKRRIEKQEITLLSSHVLHLRRDILDLKAQLER
jgi:hypothetical protein